MCDISKEEFERQLSCLVIDDVDDEIPECLGLDIPDAEINVVGEGKPVFSSLSSSKTDNRPHIQVPNPLGAIDTLAPHVQAILKESPKERGARFDHVLDFKHLPKTTAKPLRIIIHEMKKVLEYNYMPVNIAEKQSQISKAYVSPLLGFLDKELGSFGPKINVLILGAGVGKDIRRIRERYHGSATIVAVEPDRRAFDRLVSSYPGVRAFNCPVRDCLTKLPRHAPYDIILANMSFHYIMGVDSSQALVNLLPDLLAPAGKFYGSYVDTVSVKNSGTINALKHGHSVTYIAEDRSFKPYGERAALGVATIGVAGTMWQDPIVDTTYIYSLFDHSPLSVNIYDGHTLVFGPEGSGPIYKVPELFTSAIDRPELKMYRGVVISWPTLDPPCPWSPPVNLVDARVAGSVEQGLIFDYNKGMPLQAWESQYVDPALCWMAEKKNGIMAKLIYLGGGVTIATSTDRAWKVKGFSSKLKWDFVLQVELVPAQKGGTLVFGENVWVVATDVLKAPWGASGSFISRWKWLQDTYFRYQDPSQPWPFVLQQWVRLDTPQAFDMLTHADEGLVFQSLTAPPGSMRQGAGSARYVKRVYTKDVQVCRFVDGVPVQCIEEQTLSGEFVRIRHDKIFPNPPHVIERLNTAVSYDAIRAYVFSRVLPGLGANLKRIVANCHAGLPMDKWKPEDLVWAYYNHKHDWVAKLMPEATKYMAVMFPVVCSERATQLVIHEDTVRVEIEPEVVVIDENNVPVRVSGPLDVVDVVLKDRKVPKIPHLCLTVDDIVKSEYWDDGLRRAVNAVAYYKKAKLIEGK